MSQPCPLCSRDDSKTVIVSPAGDVEVTCETCGKYYLTDILLEDYPSELREAGFALSAFAREQNELGTAAHLSSDNWNQKASAYSNTSVERKLDLAFSYCVRLSPELGARVFIDLHKDYPLFHARSKDEAFTIFSYLEQAGLVRGVAIGSNHKDWAGQITAKGWSKSVEQVSGSRSKRCFVAMWFSKEMKALCDEFIDPCIRSCNFDPLRIDKVQHNDKICDRILAEIRRSRFLLADFTGHRGGVYFEAGFAMGLGIPVIYTCRRDHMKDAHFDTNHYNHIVWTDGADLAEQLRNRIQATIA